MLPIAAEPVPGTLDILPRYLAGAENRSLPIHRLLAAPAWRQTYDLPLEQTSVTSPDQRLRLTSNRLDPGTRWRISAAPDATAAPRWTAVLSAETPEEIVAATAQALTLLPENSDRTGQNLPQDARDAFDGDAFLDHLIATGWRGLGEHHGVRRAVSPDYLAHAFLRRAADPLDLAAGCALTVTVGAEQDDPYWQARFTANTPDQVVDAFARALLDPAPLRRDPELMDERLLAHAGFTATETGLAPLPPAHVDEDLTRAAAQALKSLLASADGYLNVEQVVESLADFPLTSHQGHTTWGELPGEQQHLAAMLTLDLVMDSARYSHQLLGLTDPPLPRAWEEQTRGAVPALPLGELAFGNEDLWSAAGLVAAEMIATADVPSGILEGIGEHIASRAVEGARWHDLPDHVWQPASDEVCRRFTALGDKAGQLFAPGSPRRAPLVEVAPLYLAGPGRLSARAPAAPLLAAGWQFIDTPFSDVYLSPCGRIRATALHEEGGARWHAVHIDPPTGQRVWHVTADEQTPAEITTAVHAALAAALAGAPDDLRHPALSGGLESLADAGWTMDGMPGRIVWTAPDGMASVSRTTSAAALTDGANPNWVVSGGDRRPDGPGWSIEMSRHSPRLLLQAVSAALADPAPVARLARQIPAAHSAHLITTTLEQRPAAPAGSDRAAAARHRTVDTAAALADGAPVPEQHQSPHRGRQR
ncbi:DUF317 domain-containing protein [Kitasatospora sp. NPDC088783]|uniref:DUF317 domain-containing protein n=1 Tax=Kitasatospora sp. NPDC088783 TaxID=3364077 RepID=UPI003822F95D